MHELNKTFHILLHYLVSAELLCSCDKNWFVCYTAFQSLCHRNLEERISGQGVTIKWTLGVLRTRALGLAETPGFHRGPNNNSGEVTEYNGSWWKLVTGQQWAIITGAFRRSKHGSFITHSRGGSIGRGKRTSSDITRNTSFFTCQNYSSESRPWMAKYWTSQLMILIDRVCSDEAISINESASCTVGFICIVNVN